MRQEFHSATSGSSMELHSHWSSMVGSKKKTGLVKLPCTTFYPAVRMQVQLIEIYCWKLLSHHDRVISFSTVANSLLFDATFHLQTRLVDMKWRNHTILANFGYHTWHIVWHVLRKKKINSIPLCDVSAAWNVVCREFISFLQNIMVTVYIVLYFTW